MTRLRIDVLRDGDLQSIAGNLRRADADELGVTGLSPLDALNESVRVSEWARVLRFGADPACVFGLRVDGDVGIPWMIGTPLVARRPVEFMKLSRSVVSRMADGRRLLVNLVDARNLTAIRWLTRLGFTIDAGQPVDLNGYTFYRFHKHVHPR